MTMIAFTTNKACPVVLGDLLISHATQPDQFTIPTLSEDIIQYLSGQSNFPISLNQKIYIIQKNVCVAFSGIVSSFKRFLEDIKMFCAIHDDVDMRKMAGFLREHASDPGIDDFSVLILVAERTQNDIEVGIIKRGNWLIGTLPFYENVEATGSGAADFIEEIASQGNYFSTHSENDPLYAVEMHTIMVSKILSRERATLHTVRKHWGAGFEIIYWNGFEFMKVDDIVYLLNNGNITKEGYVDVPVPTLILRYKYHGEILTITCIYSTKGTNQTTESEYIINCEEFSVKQFNVMPIDLPPGSADSGVNNDLSFKSYTNAMGYVLETPTGLYMPASLHMGRELEVDYVHGRSLKITMKKEVTDKLIREGRAILFPD